MRVILVLVKPNRVVKNRTALNTGKEFWKRFLMMLKVLLILAIILALTVAAHLLVHKSLVRLLIINSPGLKISLLIALVLLALSFMAAFFLLQWQENALTIGLYRLAAIWTALFLNLLMAMLVPS